MTTKLTLEDFNQLTQPLIGQPLSQLHYSYGDVLILDFGELIPYTHPKLSHLKTSEWSLVIKMANWTGNTTPVVKLQTLVNLKIKENLQLTLTLSYENGLTNDHEVIPNPKEAEDLPFWELWIPGNSYIVASNVGLQLRLKDEIIT